MNQYFWISTIPLVAVPFFSAYSLRSTTAFHHTPAPSVYRADSSCRLMPVTGSPFVLLLGGFYPRIQPFCVSIYLMTSLKNGDGLGIALSGRGTIELLDVSNFDRLILALSSMFPK
eukprot:s23_g13.t1